MKQKYQIAWWNVENLFDVQNSTERPDWLQRALNSELIGWDDNVLSKKINNLSSIIQKMNNKTGPDILGVCEVENLVVLKRLVESLAPTGRNYDIVHHDMSDERGIDIAFIYDTKKFDFEEYFSHVVLKRNATRDIFQANFKTKSGNPLILIGNHWPARISGELETEPYRSIAAETMSYWLERTIAIRGSDTAVLAMGDFNDEPFSRSVSEYGLSTNSPTKVVNSRAPRMFNLMWPFLGKGMGTFYYVNFPFLFDQFLASKGLLKSSSKIKIINESGNYQVAIEIFDEMKSGGDYPSPVIFGRPAEKNSFNPNGFSDHYPISVMLEE